MFRFHASAANYYCLPCVFYFFVFKKDFHHDVTLKKELVLYLDGVKEHPCVHDREIELAEGLLT